MADEKLNKLAAGIGDRDSLERWLEALPEAERGQAAAVISARAALRVFPLVLDVWRLGDETLSQKHKIDLTLQSWRAMLISAVACKYPTADMNADAAHAARASADAAHAARASAASASASADATRAAAHATRASARAAANAAAHAARASADAAHAATTNIDLWPFIAVGVNWWMENRENPPSVEGLSAPQALRRAIMSESLWEGGDTSTRTMMRNALGQMLQSLNKFEDSEIAKTTNFKLVAKWYRGVAGLDGGRMQSPWGDEKDREIAQKPEEFWERDPQVVMDEVAEIVGWPDKYKQKPGGGTGGASGTNKITKDAVLRNKSAVVLQVAGIKNSIAAERESLGDKPNDSEKLEVWELQQSFLERLEGQTNSVLELVDDMGVMPDRSAEEAASLLTEYANEFENWMRTNKPEVVDSVLRLGSAGVFVGLLSMMGASMPIATPVVLALTCGKKATDLLQKLVVGKKKK